jgi:hypothetical protein
MISGFEKKGWYGAPILPDVIMQHIDCLIMHQEDVYLVLVNEMLLAKKRVPGAYFLYDEMRSFSWEHDREKKTYGMVEKVSKSQNTRYSIALCHNSHHRSFVT